MAHELWHGETNNVIDWFDTASQAEDVILAALERTGEDVLDGTYLVRDGGGDTTHFLAEGIDFAGAIRKMWRLAGQTTS